ncbi:T9SS type A sorting domain-containing protein [Dyadobacter crusticola]|uniref:T9SS type A sorting domain-containing protein n=1 Tax=Dyadobacter crusticola TaxID=292407 RepID=UPI00068AACD4|nr:T9SS type A sorting domain-containing protein [Dyadobacter crusticola]
MNKNYTTLNSLFKSSLIVALVQGYLIASPGGIAPAFSGTASSKETGSKINPFLRFDQSNKGLAPLASGTLIFSSNPADGSWDDGIAEDGQGGAGDISDITIQIELIADASGTNLGLPLNWKSASELSNADGFTGLTTFDQSINSTGWPGFAIKSVDSKEFLLSGFQWYDWGGYTGESVNVVGYRDGFQVATGAFNSNQDGNHITVNLDETFANVDEVRILFSSGLGWGSINNVVVGEPVPLPVKLISFKASNSEKATDLVWTTTEESNASHFEIQRSTDGKTFRNVGEVQAKGESNSIESYHFSDFRSASMLLSTLYYRLKMIDKDGTFTFSSISSVMPDRTLPVIYPNPVSEKLHLSEQILGNLQSISIVDLKGSVIYQSNTVEQSGISASRIKAGLYMLRITYNHGEVLSEKVLVAH